MGQVGDLIGAQGAPATGVLGPSEHPGLEEGAIDDQLRATRWVRRCKLPDPRFRQSVEDFLAIESSKPPSPRKCKKCGTLMDHFIATFTFFGDVETWDVPLPICIRCDEECGFGATQPHAA